MPWYKDWFNSEYYHLLYRHRDEKEAETFIDNLIGHFNLKPGHRILDLPCGRGRHSYYLAKKGFQVTGADLSDKSIEFAQKNKLPNLNYGVHDMLHSFPEGNFDALLNLFTSFGYFEEEESDILALKNMRNALRQDGILVIDFFNICSEASLCKEEEVTTIDGITFKTRKNIKDGFVIKNVHCKNGDHELHFYEKVRLLTLDDFKRLLKATGFEITKIFGDYNLHPYDPTHSERLIIAAKKI